MTQGDDRKHIRYELANAAKADVQVIEAAEEEKIIVTLRAQVVDVSYGGLMLITSGIPPEMVRALELRRYYLAVKLLHPAARLELEGEVRWANSVSEGLRTAVGMRFLHPNPHTSEAIRQLFAIVGAGTKTARPIARYVAAIGCALLIVGLWRWEAHRRSGAEATARSATTALAGAIETHRTLQQHVDVTTRELAALRNAQHAGDVLELRDEARGLRSGELRISAPEQHRLTTRVELVNQTDSHEDLVHLTRLQVADEKLILFLDSTAAGQRLQTFRVDVTIRASYFSAATQLVARRRICERTGLSFRQRPQLSFECWLGRGPLPYNLEIGLVERPDGH